MPISVACPQCAKTLRAPDTHAGKRARCPNCKAVVSVPPAEAPAAAADDDTYGISQEELPVRPTYAPPPAVARSPEEAYAEAVSRTLQGGEARATGGLSPRRSETRAVRVPVPVAGEKKSTALPYLFVLTLVPLVFSLLASGNDLPERLGRTIEAHPELLAKLDGGLSREELLGALPDGRIEGAHLAYGSWLHWLYALVSAALFCGLIVALFERGEARLVKLLAVGALTATVGIFLLLAFQWVAAWTQGFWIRGRSVVVILFYIVKFIGFSYRAALDPENGFLLSFLGFTLGVGLCEEFTKAAPLFVKVHNGDNMSWRAACVLGLASGVGFGVAEGIMYSADHYNGMATFGIYTVRFISCVGLHAIWTASVALMLWHNQELAAGDLDWGDWLLGLLKVQGVPMVLHGLYDTLLKRDMHLLALLTALASFAWLAFLLARSRQSDPEPEAAGFAVA
ncbi:MAG TPA: PrsW family glutamic-type intramembrane protease [Pirellulales bacterium]|nr:PrsW family glutamic-type intramembrane protease [Pirellulales bacterium]